MDYKKIGRYIKSKREEQGLSQYDVAEMIIISREAVSKWERGVSLPDISILGKLSDILGVSIEEILVGEDIKNDKNKLFDEFLKFIKINNKNKKIIFILFLILLTSIFSFFIYYFNISYDSVRVFKFQSDMKNEVYLKDGIFIISNKKIIFKGGYIEGRNFGTDNIRENLESISVYYFIDGRRYEIWGYDREQQSFYRDNVIDERLGYDEYFYSDDLDKMLNNMYVTIKVFDKEYTSKIELNELYSNDELNNFKFDNI